MKGILNNRVSLSVSAVLLVLALIGAITSGAAPANVVKQTTLLGYSQQGVFNYSVTTKPASLYGTAPDALLSPSVYPAAILDTLDFTFSYAPAVPAPITGRVEAVLGNQDIWQKVILLGSAKSGVGSLALDFTLNPAQLEKIYDDAEKQLGITTTPHLVTINAYVDTESTNFVQSLNLKMDKSLVVVDNSNLRQTQPTATGTLEYTAHLKEGSTALTSANKYPAAIADRIDFSYQYSGLSQSPDRVSIEAILENPGIWQQKMALIPAAANLGQSASLNFSLDLASLNNKFRDIEKALGIAPDSRNLTIKASVITSGVTYTQTLPLTLSNTVIEIGGNLNSEQAPFSGKFDYSVQLSANNILGVSTLQPPASGSAPALSLDIADLHSPQLPEAVPAVVLGPGDTIYVKLVDQIDASFLYQFTADQPVDNMRQDVVLSALLTTPGSWSRTFTLLEESGSGNFSLDFPIDFAGYLDLVNTIGQEIGASTGEYNLTINARVHSTGETQYGKIDENYSQDLRGVFKGGILTWNTDLSKTQVGGIKTIENIANPQKYLGLPLAAAKIIFWLLAGVFLLLTALTGWANYKNRPVRVQTTDKMVAQLKKKYGERITELAGNSMIDVEDARNVLIVNSMEDLINIADEVAKPIVYREPGTKGELHTFFVLDGVTRYQYSL